MTSKTFFFFCDEAWFHHFGFDNFQDYRTWSALGLHNGIEIPLRPIAKKKKKKTFQFDHFEQFF
jgi:hypothetical protein